jgi:hypothetical protein
MDGRAYGGAVPWRELEEALMRTLAKHPEAREAVVRELAELASRRRP